MSTADAYYVQPIKVGAIWMALAISDGAVVRKPRFGLTYDRAIDRLLRVSEKEITQ